MRTRPTLKFGTETGGTTIMVTLMLLVLLTVAAVGMSRNSFREAVIIGTSRQGAQVRNVGDSGIEWSIFWMDPANTTSPTPTASNLKTLKTQLLQNADQSGVPYDPTTLGVYSTVNPPPPPADLFFTPLTNPAAGMTTYMGYSIALTRMGKLPVTDMSQTADASGFRPAAGGEIKQAPDLWAVRSDARVIIGGGTFAPTFIHAKEAWISTPVQ